MERKRHFKEILYLHVISSLIDYTYYANIQILKCFHCKKMLLFLTAVATNQVKNLKRNSTTLVIDFNRLTLSFHSKVSKNGVFLSCRIFSASGHETVYFLLIHAFCFIHPFKLFILRNGERKRTCRGASR